MLFGDPSTVTLRVGNPGTEPYGYNLSLRDVLPPGISYVPGSVSAPVEPRVLPNAPGTGQTTLIFDNVTDLSPGSSYSLSYDVEHSTSTYGIGDSYVNQAGAYINDDARFVPDFAADGTPSGDFTGSASDSASTSISAIEIVKSEPSPEGELLRGAHDHQTVYTLTVRNNGIEPTTGLTVEDWLPAGLEYLECGADDHTTDAPTNPDSSPDEYAGSGPLNPGNAPSAPDCQAPDLVETVVTDPDGAGPLPTDVYTHVVWTGLGAVPAGGQMRIAYVAAVPLRENTTSWTNPIVPTPASLAQGSNLDNNSGPETQDEQALTNYARVTGDYDGTLPVSDDHSITRSGEDLRVLKGVNLDTINQGQISTWSLQIDTSEYRYVDDLRVIDTLPDGLCPLGATNLEGGGDQQAECNPTGAMPSAAYTSVNEAVDGSWSLAWDQTTVPQLARMQPSSSFTIDFPTKTRASYQENFEDDEPVRTEDSWENTVEIAGADFRICTPADPEDCTAGGTMIDGDEPNGQDDLDTSAASQQAGGVTIDKKVRQATPGMVDCATGTYVDGPPPDYGPGDRVCWQLRIDFASLLDTGQPNVTDFLPPGVSYVPGSAVRTANDTLPSTAFDDSDAGDGVLTWALGTDVPEGGLVFEWRFATEVRQVVGDAEGDILGNLMKLSYANSEGETFPLRDEVNFERSQALLHLVKGVRDVNDAPAGGNPANTDGATVAEDDVVTFRVDVSNAGDLDAEDAVIWDELQDGITCADVPPASISDGGTCSGTRITWTGIDVAAAGAHTITYDVTIPNGVAPGRQFDDEAGVVSYTSDTNTGGSFTYVPQNNINPAAPSANALAADDPSFVQTRALTFTKTRTTDIAETGNNLASQATIGEGVNYTMTLVIPEGTTIYDGHFTDTLGPRHGEMTSVDVTLNGGPLPGDPGWSAAMDPTTGFFEVFFPGGYTNLPGSGDDTFVFTMEAPVADVAGNRRTPPPQTLSNTGHFDWQDEAGTPHELNPSIATTIVEPNVQVTKNENDPDDVVSPGQTVSYTVTATNPTGAGVSTAHDLQLVDHVPPGLTPVEASISNGGTWNSGARTITWTIASLAPNASAPRTYSVTVDNPATAGSTFPNEVDLTATSMAGAVAGERGPGSPVTTGYVAEATDTVRLADATLTKDVSPGSATVGDEVTYTVNVTFPGSITYYDATVIDSLPDGMDFDSTVSVTCDGGPCTPAVTPLAPQPQSDGSTRLGWFLDDLPNQPAARNYTITYTAHVDDTYVPEGTLVSNGQTLTNVAGAFYNGDDVIIGVPPSIPPNNTFEDGSGPDNAQVNVVEPVVAIDKNVSSDPDADDARPTQPGDSYTYSLVVRNTGTSPAYDVEVTDTPDETKLDNLVVAPNPAANVTDGDGSDGSLGWTIPGPIPPNGSVTLTYTADLVPSAQLSDGDTVVNTADVPLYWGVPVAERLANPMRDYRSYTNVPDDTVTLTVHLPQLAVSKTTGGAGFPESEVAQVGEPFPWRVVISNTSTQAVAESVDVSDVLPPNWTYVAGSASFAPGGAAEPTITPAPGGDTLTWENRGDLAPGGEMVLTFQARPTVAAIGNGTGAGSPHVNDAIAVAEDASGATGSADGPYRDEDAAEAILQLPDLGVNKTPDAGSVTAGANATYSVVVSNTGPVPARDVVVRDVLGAGQTYTPGTATAPPGAGFSEFSVTPGPGPATTIEWRIGQIPAGGSVTITLPVETDSSLPAGTTLVNDAAVTSREITTPETNDGSYETTVDSDVGIVKQAQAADVNAGEEMDFTMRVTNHGPSDATGVTVEDVLPANLEFVSATTPACTEDTGTVSCAIGDLAAGNFVDLTLRVRVDPDETSGVSNTATVDSTTPDSNPTNDSSTATKPVGVAANVRVVKTAPTEPVLQGTSFDYVIRVENAGVSAATNVTLSDDLPDGVEYEAVTPDPGPCSEAGGTINCAFGTMQPGDSVEVTVRVLAVDVGTPLNTAAVDTPSDETTETDNQSTVPVTIVPTADLGVTKTAPATGTPGGQIDYQLEVVNNGPSPATGVSVVDTLPAGTQYVSADPECSHDAGLVTCDAGDMAVSESRSFTITVTIPFALGGQTLTNTVVVAGNEGDLVPENDSDEATTVVEPAADLAISKTAGGATAGGTATWTLVVQNHGPSTGDPVTVTDMLPEGTTFASAAPSQGNCSAAGAEVTCNLGSLASGGSAQISVTASVAAGTAGQTLRNRATVRAPQVDPDPSNNEAESVTTIVDPPPGGPNVTLRKTTSTDRPALGKVFRYRLLVQNEGDQPARRVRVVDTLNKSVRIRNVKTSTGRCSEDGSTVECSIRTLAPGDEATITLAVVPTEPGPLRNAASATIGRGQDIRLLDNRDVVGVRVRALAARLGVSKTAARSAVRGGETVRFRIAVNTRGRAVADAWVCDRLPAGLVFVRARGATFRKGRACWQWGYMGSGARRVVTVVARAERGFTRRTVRNVAVAAAMNARRRSDAARVQVDPAFGGVGGGVTG